MPTPDLPEPTIKPTCYAVSLLPEDDINYRFHAVMVTYCGDGRWAITHPVTDTCFGTDGEWADGIKPYGRGDDWLDTHRFDHDTALELAKQAAPTVTLNGISTADLLARTARP
jgi:hypothetical protein